MELSEHESGFHSGAPTVTATTNANSVIKCFIWFDLVLPSERVDRSIDGKVGDTQRKSL